MEVLLRLKGQRDRNEIAQAFFKEMVQGLGFNPNPHGVMADALLCQHVDLFSAIRADWVHNLLAHGTFSKECS
eukprot:5069838-Pyramimonas_sp.AAC.1